METSILETPIVTVYVPTKNRRHLLERCLESILNQSYRRLDVIVVDDGSNDGSLEYLEVVSRRDERLRVLKNSKEPGACGSRNTAIFSAKGKLITGVDDDDYLLPWYIECFVKNWEKRSLGVVFLYSHQRVLMEGGGVKRKRKKCHIRNADILICNNWVGNQVFTSTSLLQEVGGYDPNFPAWQDYECWYRLLLLSAGTAQCSDMDGYIMDVSHGFHRISSQKVEKIRAAYVLFCDKHRLSDRKRDILSLKLRNYDRKAPSPKAILQSIVMYPFYDNVKNAFFLLLSYVRRSFLLR
ncbi:glycosyltransferase family A protein [Halomonas sp. OfavH-34-E]|uniref:glycosyltransferase family 2 protein n=1 Tax=unclassified Halomonas TaxID=2609666 RepID=UPI001DA1C0CE|nr:glycosyltransferase family 2 protein [Gammaproteobacteria bacterium]